MPRLKVFRTAIGFHDAIVAAPSRKAALAAWGANNDLFAKHLAEEITDPKLAQQALARPGEVIRLTRGSTSEQLAALAASPRRARRTKAAEPEQIALPPKPDPEPLNLARQAIERERQRQKDERASLDRRKAALAEEEKELKAEQSTRMKDLQDRARRMKKSYDAELKTWEAATR